MSSSVRELDPQLPPMLSGPVLSVVVVGAAAVLGLITVSEPVLAAGAAAVFLLGLAAVSVPKVATFAAIFLLYSNVAVVAVHREELEEAHADLRALGFEPHSEEPAEIAAETAI